MSTGGTVRLWHDDEGWGVVDSPATPGGRCLHEGDNVHVEVVHDPSAGHRSTLTLTDDHPEEPR